MDIDYNTYSETWKIMRDWYDWQLRIKEAGTEYLPMTSGMLKDYNSSSTTDKQHAKRIYAGYQMRAMAGLKGFTRAAIDDSVSTVHKEVSTYELPAEYEYLIEEAGDNGEPLKEVHKDINHRQFMFSRGGYLLDIDTQEGQEPRFYISSYDPERIIKYAYKPNERKNKLWYVVIDTSEYLATNSETTANDEYLILGLQDGKFFQKVVYALPPDTFNPEDLTLEDNDFIIYRGNYISEIPFLYICDRDIKPEYNMPFYLNVAYMDWDYYLGMADYKQHLHENSQGVWAFIGFSENDVKQIRMGAGGYAATENQDASVEHVGVASDGLEQQRLALSDTENSYANESVTALKQIAGESGTAKQLMMDAKTLKLVDVVLTGAMGLQTLLRFIPKWTGAENIDKFNVMPNLDFFAKDIDPALIRELVSAKAAGLPLALETLHSILKGYNLTEKSFEQEKEAIQGEETIIEEEIVTAEEV